MHIIDGKPIVRRSAFQSYDRGTREAADAIAQLSSQQLDRSLEFELKTMRTCARPSPLACCPQKHCSPASWCYPSPEEADPC